MLDCVSDVGVYVGASSVKAGVKEGMKDGTKKNVEDGAPDVGVYACKNDGTRFDCILKLGGTGIDVGVNVDVGS